MKVIQLFTLLILFTALMPISIGDEPLDFDVELKGVEIYQYATFNMTLTSNPISINDPSAFDIGYRTDREILGKLRDFLYKESESENSPILKISPVKGEIDELIEIELKDGTILYFDGIILKRVVRLDSYKFKTIDGNPKVDEPAISDHTVNPLPHQYDGVREIRKFLSFIAETEENYQNRLDLNENPLTEIWIYTIVLADQMIITTKNQKYTDIRECCEFLRKNWSYFITLEGITYKKVTVYSSKHLHFYLEKVEFICFEKKMENKDFLIQRLIMFYETDGTLLQIEERIKNLKKITESNNFTFEEFVETYSNAISSFIKFEYFLKKSLEFYDKNLYVSLEYNKWNDFVSIKPDCEKYLLELSILEKNFGLLREKHMVEATKETLERSTNMLSVMIETLERSTNMLVVMIITLAVMIISFLIALPGHIVFDWCRNRSRRNFYLREDIESGRIR